MKIFLTGSTGYIGSAVAEALKAAGHSVTGLARSDEAARKLESKGIGVVRGDLSDSAVLSSAARAAGAVINTALPWTPDAPQIDRAATEVLVAAGKPLVYTSGVWVHGDTHGSVANEETPLDPAPLVAWRPAVEQVALESGHGVVIRPAMVYGRRGGWVAGFVKSARERGSLGTGA